jgi:hypothetical protein
MRKEEWLIVALVLIIVGLWFFPDLTKEILRAAMYDLKTITGAMINSLG